MSTEVVVHVIWAGVTVSSVFMVVAAITFFNWIDRRK